MSGSNTDKLTYYREIFLWNLEKNSTRVSTLQLAKDTLDYLRKVVNLGEYENIEDAVKLLRKEGSIIYGFNKNEYVIRNMVLSVIKMMREQWHRFKLGPEAILNPYESLNKLWSEGDNNDKQINPEKLKEETDSLIDELREEMKLCSKNMSKQTINHILKTDTVITFKLNTANTLKAFLQAARKVHPNLNIIQVSDTEEIGSFENETISSCDVPDAMGKATRVVISCAAVLADGSCIAQSGTLSLCLAAKRHSVPVLVLCVPYKLTPRFMQKSENFQIECNPMLAMEIKNLEAFENINVSSSIFDLIPADLISLYITPTSTVKSVHVSRLMGEYYHPEDLYGQD
uniref:Translation initiation factor eIF-2B subunit beta n=1 Tax=Rhabditophanes sp. KR3021 TaxID=114890 RepID=A0AC35UAE1_9BILA